MSSRILITGGSGFVGRALTEELINRGYEVAHLSRRSASNGDFKTFRWKLEDRFIEKGALDFPDHIIHLAGAGVFEKRWTPDYKREIMNSRVQSANLLFQSFKDRNLKTFISASGISVYGIDTGSILLTENSDSGSDFLAEVVKEWERAADQFAVNGTRTVKVRIGIVFGEKGGALEKIVTPIKFGFGAKIGDGRQYISWIHLSDLVKLFIYLLERKELNGVYNATSPHPATNEEVTRVAARILNRPLWLPAVPSIALKVALGKEKSMLALGGNKVSSEKIQKEGFQFSFSNLEKALYDLLK